MDSGCRDARRGTTNAQIAAGGPVASLAIRPDGKQLASVGGTNLVKLWKTENGQPWTGAGDQALPEIKGDMHAAASAAAARRMVDLVTAQVADAKKAVTEAEAKVVAAEEAKKTAATAAETAVAAAAAKVEALKGLTAAKEAADKLLATLTPLVKTAQDAAAPFQQCWKRIRKMAISSCLPKRRKS